MKDVRAGLGSSEEPQTVQEASATELERRLSLTLMAALRVHDDLHSVMRHVMQWVQVHIGCEAVGIRLADGEDFPYFEVRGFPDEFVAAERHLCARGECGATLRDAAGRPILECMCGNVLQGRTDERKPFFTAAGSFWTNSTTRLLATTTEVDRQSRTRNRCHGAGYESVGLFPLRVQGRTFGLLQVNDHRPGRFDPASLALLEQLSEVVALALSERLAEERLQRSLEEKNTLLRELQHRVKNNLQTLVSMIRLQARGLEDTNARAFALATQARIEAMAIAHEQLDSQGTMKDVDLAGLVKSLAQAACTANGFPVTRLRLEIPETPLLLGPDRAIAFGLMVHELLVNSIRHAFPSGELGTVAVSLESRSGADVALCIRDDGVGIPEGVGFPNARTFGLSLVELLAKQLGATLSLRRSPGASVELTLASTSHAGAP